MKNLKMTPWEKKSWEVLRQMYSTTEAGYWVSCEMDGLVKEGMGKREARHAILMGVGQIAKKLRNPSDFVHLEKYLFPGKIFGILAELEEE